MKRLMLAVVTMTAMAVPVFAQATTASPRPAATTQAAGKADNGRTAGVKKHTARRKTGAKRRAPVHHAHRSRPATKS